MKNTLRKHQFWYITFGVSLIALILLSIMPHNAYIRYQLLDIGTYKKSKWIYERIHFSDTPIDIAFFGTSHTLNGIDSELVEYAINESSSPTRHVVNFSIPHFGRDMHYTLIKLLLEEHQPELIILELRESEARDLHPGTHYLADPFDLYNAPLLLNLRYIGNVIRLPGRNLKALLHEWAYPYTDKMISHTDIEDHNNMALYFPDGRARDIFVSKEELAKQSASEKRAAPYKYHTLPDWKSYLFFNANLNYVRDIQALAKSKGVKVAALFLPEYGTTALPSNHPLLESDLPVISAPMPFYLRDDVFNDLGHLNKRGATSMSVNAARQIKQQLKN